MCNPRRIEITVTQQIDEAWEQEVSRTIEVRERVEGAARIRRPLDASLSQPVLRALEHAMADPSSGWSPVEGGFRREVEGGHVIYHSADRSLELVAALAEEVTASGEASRRVAGRLVAALEDVGTADYYDDGYAGRDENWARRKAGEEAQRKLSSSAREQVDSARTRADLESGGEVEAEAAGKAQEALARKAEERRRELDQQAREQLTEVGALGRQAFHRVLGQAYRRVLLAYANTQGAENVSCTETGDSIEIEFFVRR